MSISLKTNMHSSHIKLPAFMFLLLALLSVFGVAHADTPLPAMDEANIKVDIIEPERDVGYVVGDVLKRTVTLEVKKPYALVETSLPIVGYEHRYQGQITGIELTGISTSQKEHDESTIYTIDLAYQVFTRGKVAKPAMLRPEILKFKSAKNGEVLQYQIPSFKFRISPLSVFGQVKIEDEMSTFRPPLLLDASPEKFRLKILLGVLAVALTGLLYIFGMRAWLPRMGAPFAKAFRDIRKLPDNTDSLQQAVARMHKALNATAGHSLFHDNLDKFISQKPAFKPVEAEIDHFFGLSRQVFFEPQAQHQAGEAPLLWLRSFCRHCRDCERGLVPETSV
jgi:mxaA protein